MHIHMNQVSKLWRTSACHVVMIEASGCWLVAAEASAGSGGVKYLVACPARELTGRFVVRYSEVFRQAHVKVILMSLTLSRAGTSIISPKYVKPDPWRWSVLLEGRKLFNTVAKRNENSIEFVSYFGEAVIVLFSP